MKKNTLLSGMALVAGLFALSPRASAQITITQADLPTTPLTVITDSDGSTKPLPLGPSASAQSWDFSHLQKQKTKTINFMTPGATPYGSTFSSANLADSTYGGNGYNFFSAGSSQFAVEGAEENQLVSGDNFKIEINLAPEFVQANLPATYGNVVPPSVALGSQTFSVTFSIVVTGEKFDTYIEYSDTVDAWGTMKMPNGHTYNVLRQKHHEVDYDSVYLKIANTWTYYERIISNKNQYDWYTNGVGYILAEEDMSPTFDTIVDVVWDTNAPAPTSINEISVANNVNVYPNPANNQINFVTGIKQDAYISIYDLTGRELDKVAVKNGMSALNTNTYNNGIYLYSLTDNSGNLLDRGKFIVQH